MTKELNIILNDKEKSMYDSLVNEKDKANYLKSIQLRRKADKLQADISQRKRKQDNHNKIVLGGVLVEIFGEEIKTIITDSEVKKDYTKLNAFKEFLEKNKTDVEKILCDDVVETTENVDVTHDN